GPAVAIAKELARRGDTVRFIGQSQQREALEDHGFGFAEFSAPGSWTATGKRGGVKNAIGFLRLLTGRRLGRDIVANVKASPTDLVVVDCLLFGALDVVAKAGLRHAVLVHSLVEAIHRNISGGAPGVVARLAGLHPRTAWADADAVLVATLEELDQHEGAKVALRYTGPALSVSSPTRMSTATSTAMSTATPTVLVSLSTTYVAGQVDVLQKILDAVAGLPARFIVTTGPAMSPKELRSPANAELHDYLPHSDVMTSASLVVGHGGHSTTMLALAHNLPLVVVPINLVFDQVIIGTVIQNRGAGLTIPSSSSVAALRDAIDRMLADGPHRTEAARLGAAIRATDGVNTAADLLESLVPTTVTG
ncbi:MAG: glycosyltransferase, partial [Terrimesophilobacter sp.]